MSYLEPKIRYMNSVSGSSAGNLPDAEQAYWTKLETDGPPAGAVTSADITDATTVGVSVLTATDAAAARTAIGAGTSNLALGTTASTALAGNTAIPTIPATLPPTDASVTNAKVAAGAAIALNKLANVVAGTDGLAAGTIQATLQALATRIQALEDAAAV